MERKGEAKIIYEKLKQELGEKEADSEIEKARKDLQRLGIKWRVSWEDAVLYLAEKRKKEEERREKTLTRYLIKHEGKHWKIYYYPIESFENELSDFGKFLEELEEKGENVLAIIPNTGIVPTSLLLGTSFQGVKGFAVIAGKKIN